MKLLVFAFGVCFLFGLSIPVCAQSDIKSVVTGSITDYFGSLVPEATVIAIGRGGKKYEVKSGNDGRYELRGLGGGVYKIQVIRRPFKTFVINEYQIMNRGGLRLDVSLICEDCETLSLPFKPDPRKGKNR